MDGRIARLAANARQRTRTRTYTHAHAHARRYKEAYILETLAFVDCLVNDKPSPCSGEDGLVALVMAIAAGTSAEERRWVKFSELGQQLCGLSGELPFDIDACDLVVEDSQKEGGVLNLGKLAKILTNSKAEAEKMESEGKKPWWKLR